MRMAGTARRAARLHCEGFRHTNPRAPHMGACRPQASAGVARRHHARTLPGALPFADLRRATAGFGGAAP